MIIGSRAIKHWWDKFHPGQEVFKVREGSDWDIIGDPRSEESLRKFHKIPDNDRIEWHDPFHLNNSVMEYMFTSDGVCNPYGLALIYRSHLHRDYKWDGHITKYHKFILPLLGDVSVLLSDPLLVERIKLTKAAYPQGNPNLNQSNMDFFDDNVVKVYDHDYIHELYAYEDRPMFEKLKHKGKEDSAWCAKDLWDKLTETQKLKCVAEETYVIATERFMIPKDWNFNPKQAYYMALKKVCTTLCSGWFRDFAIDNFPKVLGMYDPERFNSVKGKLNA